MQKLLTLAAVAALPLLATAPAQAATYAIDPMHTFTTFEIGHFGASVNRGRFDEKSGTVQFDQRRKTGKIDITFKAASINTGTKAFDDHLKSDDLFAAEKHPDIRFVSDNFIFDGDKVKAVTGKLTLLGQTHPITFNANQFNCYPNPMAKTEACGGDFVAEIDRTQWGMNYGVDFGMPKSVRILATIEAFKQ